MLSKNSNIIQLRDLTKTKNQEIVEKLLIFLILSFSMITITAKQMMWISGSNQINLLGVYGTKKVVNPNNVPGSRRGAVSWIDTSNNLYLFGGWGYATSSTVGMQNFNCLVLIVFRNFKRSMEI